MDLVPVSAAAPRAPGASPGSAALYDGAIAVVQRRVLSRELQAPASVESDGSVAAHVNADALAALRRGEAAFFVAPPLAAPGLRVTLDPSVLPAPWDEATSRIGLRFDGSGVPGVVGQVGWITIGATARDVLVVPSSAVRFSPEGAYVLAAADDGTFSPKKIEIGSAAAGLTAVAAGLRERERVLARYTAFVEAELLLRARPQTASGAAP